jgi:VWFA-related protein
MLAQQPTFRTRTTLVELSVVAVDDAGRPVTDLTKDDFVILDRGQPQRIAFFRFEGAPENPKAASLPENTFTNRPEYTAPDARNVTAIVLDAVNSRVWDQATAREQLLRYLDTVPQGTRVGMYQLGWRIRVLHDFTTDLASLRTHVRQIIADAAAHAFVSEEAYQGNDGMSADAQAMMATAAADMARVEQGYSESIDDRKRAVTLAGLETIGARLAAVPGRKSLVWLTLGMPITTTYQGFLRNHEPQIRRTAQTLAAEGVAIYPVDIQGLASTNLSTTMMPGQFPGSLMRAPAIKPNSTIDQRLWSTLTVMSDITGGRFSHNTNDMAEGLKVATNDLRGSYTLGFYTTTDSDGGWRPLEVKAHGRRGLHLTYKRGFLEDSLAAPPPLWTDALWRSTIQSPLTSTVVRLDASFEPVTGAEKGTYNLTLQIAADDLQFHSVNGKLTSDVEIGIAEKMPTGAFAYRTEPVVYSLPEGATGRDLVVRYGTRWKVRDDAAIVRVIVRDKNSGKYGTLDIPVKGGR